MLIPSDELIKKALDEGKAKLKKWNLERPDSILENWCFQAMFSKMWNMTPKLSAIRKTGLDFRFW